MTKIEWTDEVWNPVTGCTKVSQGCKNCYAESIANRFWGNRKFTDVRQHPERLNIPFHWKKPRRIFVNSMSDLFHKDVPDEFIEMVLCAMVDSQHTFIVLTKRPERMYAYLNNFVFPYGAPYKWPLQNVWLGVSAENQETTDERIPWLLKTPATVRFVSYEPALGEVDFTDYLDWDYDIIDWQSEEGPDKSPVYDLENATPPLNWLIAGCESGPCRRPADIDWFRSVRDQCQEAGVPFFLKQMDVDGKIVKMPQLDGRVWDQMPERKNAA